jgi:hypothetical protein
MLSETDLLVASLTTQREHVLGILEDLPDAALRRAVLPSGWTCLGMVRHLTVSDEKFWFRGIVAGEKIDLILTEEAARAAWMVDDQTSVAAVLGEYRAEIERSDVIIRNTALDTAPAFWPEDRWPEWRLHSLREIILHVISETACHAGHLDAVREIIDGRQWMT